MASPPVIVVDGFLPAEIALQLRRAIDEHFANPQAHRAETHQVWNYWFVPELYTYLRTGPEKVLGQERSVVFHEALRRWSIATLGMANVSWPYLSLYVPSCRQGWHNDSLNGRFGFVYSLTRDLRRTIGGETLVRREPDPFRSNLTQPQAGRGFYETVEPRFNRLLLFDDRLPHAVERIEGAMDPVEGRFVLHGHVSEGGPIIDGALPAAAAAGPIGEVLRSFREETAAAAWLYHGHARAATAHRSDGRSRRLRRAARPDLAPRSGACRLGADLRASRRSLQRPQVPPRPRARRWSRSRFLSARCRPAPAEDGTDARLPMLYREPSCMGVRPARSG